MQSQINEIRQNPNHKEDKRMDKVTSPQRELQFANPDKDPDNGRMTMNALRSYIQQLDNKAIPQFLAHLSELRDEHMPRQYSISLYEVLAREHGKNIIPYISKIMSSVMKALSSNAPSLALQQASARVVSALARYTIDPSSFEGQREAIIRDLSNPLLEVLLGRAHTLAEGAAICLQALVESEAWKFAPDDVVNEVCLRVTAALEEKGTQTVSHMKLVCFLANSDTLILEAYGRSLLKAAAQILEIGADHGNWQQRLCAVQMINSLLKSVDVGILASEIPNTIELLERCRSDRMPSVRNGVSETLETAKAIASEISTSPTYNSSSNEKEIPWEGEKSQRSSLRGSRDILKDIRMDSYTYSPVSSVDSLNAECQTPSILGYDAWANRFPHFYAEQGPHSELMDNVALSGKVGGSPFSLFSRMGESVSSNDGREIDSKRAAHHFSCNKVKDDECSGHMLQNSMLFENGDGRYISLENGMVGGSDAEVTAQHETDGNAEGNFLIGHLQKHRKATSDNFDEFWGNGDSLLGQTEDCERKPAYKEAQNEGPSQRNDFSFCLHSIPRLSANYREEAALTPQKSGSQMRIDDGSASLTLRRLARSISDNEATGGKHAQVSVALKGRMLLDNVDSVVDEHSDRSISQEGDPEESSSIWSQSVHRSESVSSASSSTVFLETTEIKEDLQSTGLTKVDNASLRINDGENKCPMMDFESVEETSAFYRVWTKATSFMETVLKVSLCVALAIPATMVAVELCSMQEEYHVLVPT